MAAPTPQYLLGCPEHQGPEDWAMHGLPTADLHPVGTRANRSFHFF